MSRDLLTPAAHDPWALAAGDFPAHRSLAEQGRFLLGYAVLAPSTKNTQPWRFKVEGDDIQLHADLTRWQRVADVDQREVYLSIGCALENLLLAAECFGLATEVRYDAAGEPRGPAAVVTLRAGGARSRQRAHLDLNTILRRRTDPGVYKGDPILAETRRRLESSAMDEGIGLFFSDEPSMQRAVDDLSCRADALLFADSRFRAELGYWAGQGIFPTSWLMARVGHLGVSYLGMGRSASHGDEGPLMGASLFGLIGTRRDDRASQVRAGQAFERLWLTAASLGISLQPLSQAVELPEVRTALAALVPLPDVFPQQPFRLGYAARPERRRTPRRRLAEMLD